MIHTKKAKNKEILWALLYFDIAKRPSTTDLPSLVVGSAIIDLPNGELITINLEIKVTDSYTSKYLILIDSLNKALERKCKNIIIHANCRWIISQLTGDREVQNKELISLHSNAISLINRLKKVEYKVISQREYNLASVAAKEFLQVRLNKQPKNNHNFSSLTKKDIKSQIDKLCKKGLTAKASEWLALKCGRDSITYISPQKLVEKIPSSVKDIINQKLLPGEDSLILMSAYRWYLRGLPPEFALHKARINQKRQPKNKKKLNIEIKKTASFTGKSKRQSASN
jgi:Reverse transcriptase-like